MDTTDSRTEPASRTLATSIAAQLRSQITAGEIAPGEKLRLDELRANFGVSLSPLREALSRLSAEGFVVMENQRGYRVAPVSEQNLMEVTRLRMETEGFALRESIRLGDDQWEGQVVASHYRLEKLQKAAPGDQKLDDWELAHRSLHQQLLSACRMPLLLQFSTTLHDLSDRYRRLFLEDHPFDANVNDEHARIVDATLQRRSDEACALLRDHIERTGHNVMVALLEKRAAPATGK